MLRILLVDDEPLVLIGLQGMLEWEKLGYTVCGTARNGSGGDRAGTCEEALAAHVLLHVNRLHFWKIPVRRRPFASPFE